MSNSQLPSEFKPRSPWSDPDTIRRQAPHEAAWEALRKGSVLAWSCVGLVVVAIVVTRILFFTLGQTIKVERALASQPLPPPPNAALPSVDGTTMELLLGVDEECRITFNLEPVSDIRATLKQAVQENAGHPITATISQHPDAEPKQAYERVIEILNALAVERVASVTLVTE